MRGGEPKPYDLTNSGRDADNGVPRSNEDRPKQRSAPRAFRNRRPPRRTVRISRELRGVSRHRRSQLFARRDRRRRQRCCKVWRVPLSAALGRPRRRNSDVHSADPSQRTGGAPAWSPAWSRTAPHGVQTDSDRSWVAGNLVPTAPKAPLSQGFLGRARQDSNL